MKFTSQEHVRVVVKAMALVIYEATQKSHFGGIPAGHLYALMMGDGISLDQFEKLVTFLVDQKMIERRASHLLVWVMPLGNDKTAETSIAE